MINRLAALLIASISFAYGQSSPPAASAGTEKKASIEGVVLNETTKDPLRRAEISLYRAAKGRVMMGGENAAYSAVTDAAGKFRIENVEPGEYTLTHRKTGYINSRNSFGFSPRTLKLSEGESRTDLRYALMPQAIVTGRVVDDEGEPVQGVSVVLLRLRYYDGARRVSQAGQQVQTNDRGEYRMINVPPGKYYVQASLRRMPMSGPAVPSTVAGAPRTAFVSTFYPSAADFAQATKIEVQAGFELSGQDIILRKERVVKVSGKVLEPNGSPAKRTWVVFAVADGITNGFTSNVSTGADEQGNFAANNIRPGQYTVIAYRMDGQSREIGQAPLNVGDVDVANVVLQLATGLEVKGTIVLEGSEEKDFDFSSFWLNMNPVDSSSPFGGVGTQPKADGTFTLSPVPAGHYTLQVHTGLTEGYVKSILVGADDVYGKEVDASAAAAGGIRIVVRLDSASVKGTAEIPDDRKAALRSPGVLLVSADPRIRKIGQFASTQIEQDGGFELKHVRPGDYLAFAFEEYDSNSMEDPEVFAALESKGRKVKLFASESKVMNLKLLPWPSEFADRLQ